MPVEIIERFNNGAEAHLECTCVGISNYEWKKLMKGSTRCNRITAVKAAHKAGIIDDWWAKQEIQRPYFNPCRHLRTKTHIIYIQSAIEHFIKIG